MNLKPIIKGFIKYFKIWWIPIVSYFVPFVIFILGLAFRRDFLVNTSLLLFLLNVLGSMISCVIQVIIRKWYLIFPQLILGGLLLYFVGMILMYSTPDFFGTHKKIPDNIEISEPLDSIPKQSDFDKYDLVLIGELGSYTYYTDIRPCEKGCFYIKAFEITSNTSLSGDRLKERSKIRVDSNSSGLFSRDFTIYEGSWGDKYGARLELWFDPIGDKLEYKMTERNFIVEGWMR